jgi:multisubunit Na+/H+ antiporter MnhG subunit
MLTITIELVLLFLAFFVLVPLIAALIGYAAWKGKPRNWDRSMYWTSFVASSAASGFLMVYAQRMRADIRNWQHLIQLVLFYVGVVLLGVAGGCMVGIFMYRRGVPSRMPSD